MSHILNKQLDQINVPQQSEQYGYVNRDTANTMYKRYKKWFRDKYGDAVKPLSFRDWIRWAESKGYVKSANGDTNEVNIESDDGQVRQAPEDISKEVVKVNGVGRAIAIAILVFSAIGIIAMLIPTPVAQPSAPAPAPSPTPTV